MRLALVVLAGGLFAAACGGADSRWIRIQSPNFEIYSTAGEASASETLKQFEQVRAFFISTLPTKDQKPLPVRIILFGSEKEYQPYRVSAAARAYYKSGAERDTIVMSHGAADNFSVSIHEYVHVVVRHAGITLPPWLGEGLAEFSTLKQVGNKMVVGTIIPARLAEIQQKQWIPLSVILAVDHASPYYNEKDRAGSFYSESWALTHMLSISADYRPKWAEFVQAIITGKDSAEALTSTYAKPLAAIDRDLQLYARSRTFGALTADAKLETVAKNYPAEAAPSFEVKLMLLDLATGNTFAGNTAGNTNAQIQQQLEKMAEEQPSRPEPYVQLGYLAWGPGKPAGDEVRDRFAKAYALGSRSPRMLWDYGRMIIASHPTDAVRVLTELSALEPERRDVKIELAGAMLNAGQPNDTVKTLLSLKGCTPEEAVRCLSAAAFAYLRMNQREEARKTAELYVNAAKASEDRLRAQQLLDTLKRPEATIVQSARSAQSVQSAPPPAPAPRPAPDPEPVRAVKTIPAIAGITTVAGKFVEFVCGEAKQFVLETPTGKLRFLVDDPNRIVISGRESGQDRESVELACGVQDPITSVELGYIAAPAVSNVDGVVRLLHFGE